MCAFVVFGSSSFAVYWEGEGEEEAVAARNSQAEISL